MPDPTSGLKGKLKMKVAIDPGHGGRNQNIGLNGYREADFALTVAIAVRGLLRDAGVSVLLTREDDTDLCPGKPWVEREDLAARCAVANSAGADLYVSIHTNAVGPGSDAASVKGTETYCYQRGGKGEALARAIQSRLVSALGTADRGVKTASFYVLRETRMPAALTEVAFHTHPDDVALLQDPGRQKTAARAITGAILDVLGIGAKEPAAGTSTPGTPILGEPQATVEQAKAWAAARGATPGFLERAEAYWRLAPDHGGVRPDLAYAQSAKETAYGRYGGVVPEGAMNPAGIKTKTGGGNDDPAAHQRFASWEEGISAHLDHLALYAGAAGYPRSATPDPRHFPGIAGVAPTAEQLGGRWAPAADYGSSIVLNYLKPLLSTAAPPVPGGQEGELEALRAENAALKREAEQRDLRLHQLEMNMAVAIGKLDEINDRLDDAYAKLQQIRAIVQ